MKSLSFAIIEIGSNNTKVHVYENEQSVFDSTTTIEFKRNYQLNKCLAETDLEKLYQVIEKSLKYTKNIYLFGCSIFRKLSSDELNKVNTYLKKTYQVEIQVVSQEDEAIYTAYGCYADISYNKDLCVFIGGGGSIELLFVRDHKIFDQRYYDFGVVDVTNTFPSLKEDYNTCTFEEVSNYVSSLLGDFSLKADVLILAGGDHLYWYNNACYELEENILYSSKNQKYMLTIEKSDQYDYDALQNSLNRIRENSDNPLWFDGSRAMKVITNVISHKIHAKYIIPTKINMEDGIAKKIIYRNTQKI